VENRRTGYVVYGTSPWNAAWLTEHNLADALSRDHPVLFVEPPISPAAPLRQGRRGASDLLTAALGRRPRQIGRLHVFRPLTLPPRSHPRARALSEPWFRAQVARAAASLELRAPRAIVAGSYAGMAGAAGERQLAYIVKDWVEAGADLLGRTSSDLRAAQATLCRDADVVFAISPALQRALRQSGVESVLLPHGFSTSLAGHYSQPPPSAYRALPRPLLGYTGRIDGRLDFELLAALADRYSRGTVVLVGAVSTRLPREALDPLRRRGNVHFLPEVPREELPCYIEHLDCCLMPYRATEWIRHAAPLKLWDYLYAGPPLVGSGCEVLFEHPPHIVRATDSKEAFIECVRDALKEAPIGRSERRRLALANTWEARAKRLEQTLDSAWTEQLAA
jgi:teichuronic acid biosynthesis glycosyltransferase TuaH